MVVVVVVVREGPPLGTDCPGEELMEMSALSDLLLLEKA